jgi:hypothetical protein
MIGKLLFEDNSKIVFSEKISRKMFFHKILETFWNFFHPRNYRKFFLHSMIEKDL